MSRDLELSSRVLPAGASSYYHDSDNDGGDRGGGSTTQPALFDISSSQSQGSLSNDHEHQKPPLSVEVENKANNSDKTAAGIIADSIDSSKNFLCRMSISHGDIGFRGDSLIDFKNGGTGSGSFMNGKGSLLSFEQNHQVWIHQPKSVDDSSIWKHDGDNIMSGAYVDHHLRQVTPASDPKGCSSSSHIPDLISNHSYYQQGKSSYGWLYSDSTVVAADRVQEAGLQERTLFKRPYMGDQSAQPSKKRCTTVAKSPSSKPNKLASTKDPQSIAAKNRRERISERLKILQELVPNGPKVDLVTMLDKAISYVKFLQLQVKVLATDEFWPAQGGTAPNIAQVKEAIDAILTSQRERSSSSK